MFLIQENSWSNEIEWENEDGTKTFIQKSKCESLLNYVLKNGDLLMSMTDTKDNVVILGNKALMDEDDRYIGGGVNLENPAV